MIPKYTLGDILEDVFYQDKKRYTYHYMITKVDMDRELYTVFSLNKGMSFKQPFRYYDNSPNTTKVA